MYTIDQEKKRIKKKNTKEKEIALSTVTHREKERERNQAWDSFYSGAPCVLSERKIDFPSFARFSRRRKTVRGARSPSARKIDRVIAIFYYYHVDIYSGELISLVNRSSNQVETGKASYFSSRRDVATAARRRLISHRLQGLISHLQLRLIKRVVRDGWIDARFFDGGFSGVL